MSFDDVTWLSRELLPRRARISFFVLEQVSSFPPIVIVVVVVVVSDSDDISEPRGASADDETSELFSDSKFQN